MIIKLNSKSYICGSCHVGNPGMYPLPEKVYRAAEKCTCIAVEADLRIPPSKSLIERITNFEKLIPQETKDKIEESLHEIGLKVDGSNPFMTVSRLTAGLMKECGLMASLGTEMHLMPFFKKTIELEGAEFAIDMFEKIAALENAAEIFSNSIRLSVSASIEDFNNMILYLRNGKYDEMHELKSAKMFSDEVRRIYLTERNERMADIIEGLEKEGEAVFVHVGAMHIGGKDGIVRILRDRGNTVDPV